MLPLSQLSTGVLIGGACAGSLAALKWGATAAFVVMAAALGIATLHLGQPLRAWKAFLGWRKSWFSREAIAFGGYVKAAGALAAVLWFKPEWLSSGIRDQASGIGHLASGIPALAGLSAIFCSIMLYADTRRAFWSFGRTAGKFFGSTLLLGLAGTSVLLAALKAPLLAWWLVPAAALLKLLIEAEAFTHWSAKGYPPLKKSALLIAGPLQGIAWTRLLTLLLGGLALPLLLSLDLASNPLPWAALSLGLLLVGEICERLLFFAAVAPDKMPGGVVA